MFRYFFSYEVISKERAFLHKKEAVSKMKQPPHVKCDLYQNLYEQFVFYMDFFHEMIFARYSSDTNRALSNYANFTLTAFKPLSPF